MSEENLNAWWENLGFEWKLVFFINAFDECLYLFENRLNPEKIADLATRDMNVVSWRIGSDYESIFDRLSPIEIFIIKNLKHLNLGDGDYLFNNVSPINSLEKLEKIDLLFHEIDISRLELAFLRKVTFLYPFYNPEILSIFQRKYPDVSLQIC